MALICLEDDNMLDYEEEVLEYQFDELDEDDLTDDAVEM